MASRALRRHTPIAALAAAALLATAGSAAANVPLTQISHDPFVNTTSQHATQVEPDTFSNGSTVIASAQLGRFCNGGATGISFSRSTDGGVTWPTQGFLPGLTATSGTGGA